MTSFKVGDRVEYTGNGSFARDLKGRRGTVRRISGWSDIRVDWDDGPRRECGVVPENLTKVDPPTLKVGDRVEYISNRTCWMTGKKGTVTSIPSLHRCINVKWDDGISFEPFPSSLELITDKENEPMNKLQASTFTHLTTHTSSNERILALQDLIQRDFFNPASGASQSEKVIRGYVEENPRGFCKDGINRFLTGVGLKPVKETVHLMDYATRQSLTYRTVCGQTQNHAVNIVHSGHHGFDNEKGELCGRCRSVLEGLVDLDG